MCGASEGALHHHDGVLVDLGPVDGCGCSPPGQCGYLDH